MPITRLVRSPERLARVELDLGRPSAAERLFLWRHRQRATNGRLLGRNGAGMSRVEAAVILGISDRAYGKLENGLRTAMLAEETEGLLRALRPLHPTHAELGLLARRRSGQMLAELQRRLGVNRSTYHVLERAGDPRIVADWEEQGFRFP